MPKVLALYHYYYPDDVAGARHFTEFCEGLAQRGWDVETWPCNRNCHDLKAKYALKTETREGVKIRRVWRPPFRQHSFLGRILNSIWMMKFWGWRFLFLSNPPDILVIGTDPIFCLVIVPFVKLRHPRVKVVHWCFDLYPEYAAANGMVRPDGPIAKTLRFFMGTGYRRCELVADIGRCMRERLERYPAKARSTHSPWAFEEPSEPPAPDPSEREALFGDARLGLLYSGNFGLPHAFERTLVLVRGLRGQSAALTYSAHGSRLGELKRALAPEDSNIRFAVFAPADRLAARLSAPDVHVVSLRSAWTGMVVPSKFFGALAIGRPLLFEGDEGSSVARWIREYGVGWVLGPGNLDQARRELLQFSGDEGRKEEMFRHCHRVYKTHFSRKTVLDAWNKDLRGLVD